MPKVLIVDDECSIADLMRDALEFEGVDCHSLYSGNQAREFLCENAVDLVISDVRMPDGDGLELLKYIHGLNHSTRMVFITGQSEFSIDKLKEMGAFAVFYKPLVVEDFLKQIKSFL